MRRAPRASTGRRSSRRLPQMRGRRVVDPPPHTLHCTKRTTGYSALRTLADALPDALADVCIESPSFDALIAVLLPSSVFNSRLGAVRGVSSLGAAGTAGVVA